MKPFFYGFVERGGVLLDVATARMHLLSDFCVEGEPSIKISGSNRKLGLGKAEGLEKLMDLYLRTNSEGIEGRKKEFLEEYAEGRYVSEADRDRIIGERRLVNFVVNDLLPHMSGHEENLGDIFGGKAKAKVKTEKKKEIDDEEVERRMGLLRGEVGIPEGENYVIKTFLDGYRGIGEKVLFWGGNVYAMKQLDPNTKGEVETLDLGQGETKNYLESYGEWDSSVRILEEAFTRQINSDAIDEFGDYLRAAIKLRAESEEDIEEIAKMNDFGKGDVGFMRRNNMFYIYHKIPSFAMLDPRPTKEGICYEFPALRVASSVELYGNQMTLNQPILVEPVWHPFTRHRDIPFQEICGSKGKYIDISDVRGVAKYIDDAKNIIMHGLTPGSIVNHEGDRERGGNYFGTPLDEKLRGREITLEEARKKELIITNKWDWNGRNNE